MYGGDMAWAQALLGGGAPSAREQLLARLETDGRISSAALHAIASVPRELFVPAAYAELAYTDVALEIGPDATISAPSMVAAMLSVLDLGPGLEVLEIGAGSGYAAATMAALGARVTGIELRPELVETARVNVTTAGLGDLVTLEAGDGRGGWPSRAPYDRVVISAAVVAVFPAWLEQLRDGGLLVYPEARENDDLLVRLTVEAGRVRREELGRCRFVRLQL